MDSVELRSTLHPDGRLELSLQGVDIGKPAPGEIIVRVDAAPVNPSDLGMLLGPADLTQAREEGSGAGKRVLIPLAPHHANALARRFGLSLCPGLEGAGVVVAAGEECGPLLGRTVAMFGGGMFARFRKITPDKCLLFPDGAPPPRCAASFVNPLTALGMLDTMRREGHSALVHTAAASNLGLMLNKLCRHEGVPIINIVRRQEQVRGLQELGAQYVCDSSSPTFFADLVAMIGETRATLAFDAIGGGALASTIISAMEAVFAPEEYYIYGSNVHKQVYVYGQLDPSPIQILRGAGNAWGVSGWLMMNHLAKLEPDAVQAMKDRIVREIDTVFASQFSAEVSLEGMLSVDTLSAVSRRSTGSKYLLTPNKAA
jgi:NADPH2:quinone reductase